MAIKRKKEKKEKKHYYCPHCKGEIELGKMMAEASFKVPRDISSERMRKVAEARWNRVKLYGF